MQGQADLGDSRVLEQLLATIERLPRMLARALADVEAEAAPRMARIGRALDSAQDDVRAAERALEHADDEDAGAYEDRLEEARDRLRALESAAAEVRDALASYKAAAREVRELERRELAGARAFLASRLEIVREYAGHTLGGRAPSASAVPASAAAPPPATDLPPLPNGFAWIPLAEIADRDAPDGLEWKKNVSRETMTIGMRAFDRDLVPLLRAGRAGRDALVAFDREHGRDDGGLVKPDSLANLYDVMFGGDTIAAERGSDGRFELHSGRHRTAIARELGWTHIPARVIGGPQ